MSLRQTLLDAPADQVMFLSESQDAITAAMIRSAAARLLPDIECGAGELYIFTRSAALFCAAYLAASAADRPLVLLPQGSADFRAEQNVPANSFVSDHENGGHWLTFDGADRQLTIEGADAELVFFTSGSSGAAKSIRRMPVAIETEARHWAEWLDGQIDHVAGTVSHQHIYGLIFRVFLPVLGKITSSDLAALSWEALSVQIHDRTLVATSPAHLTRLPDAQNGPGLDHALLRIRRGRVHLLDGHDCVGCGARLERGRRRWRPNESCSTAWRAGGRLRWPASSYDTAASACTDRAEACSRH